MVIVAILLIRYVIFEDSATALEKERLIRLKISERRSKRHARALLESSKRAAAVLKGPGAGAGASASRSRSSGRATFASILEKTAYDISTHPSESADWVNVMFAQAVAGYREDVLAGGGLHPSSAAAAANGDPFSSEKERTARDLMEEILNRKTSGSNTSFLDPIRVTEADFGDAYPIFTNVRVRPADDTGRMRIEVDVDYSDQITLAIDTKLLINFPRPRFAVLPISLSLTIVRFSGTISVELFSSDPSSTVLHSTAHAKPDSPTPRSRHQLHFSLHPDFALEASASSLLGSRAKLQDIPKIEQLLISRLRGWILDRFVWPRYWSLTLPNLVPSPAAAQPPAPAPQEEGEMRLGTGTEDVTDDSLVVPGHLSSTRQEKQAPPPTASPGAVVGSVEAWRAHTAGATIPQRSVGAGFGGPTRPSPLARSSFTADDASSVSGLRSRSTFLHG